MTIHHRRDRHSTHILKSYKGRLRDTNSQIPEPTPATLANGKAWKVVYTEQDGQHSEKIMKIWTGKNNKAYLITYTAENDEKYSKFEETAKKMINSLNICVRDRTSCLFPRRPLTPDPRRASRGKGDRPLRYGGGKGRSRGGSPTAKPWDYRISVKSKGDRTPPPNPFFYPSCPPAHQGGF